MRRLPRALGVLLLLPGCPLVEVEVEVPEVCLTYRQIDVDGIVAAAGVSTVHARYVIDDLDGLHRITDQDVSASFVRAELLALAGIDSFEFVQAARITISGGDERPDLPPVLLYECAGDCVPADGGLDMSATAPHDTLAYLRAEALVVDVELTGPLPRQRWAMSVAVCFQTTARYEYEYER